MKPFRCYTCRKRVVRLDVCEKGKYLSRVFDAKPSRGHVFEDGHTVAVPVTVFRKHSHRKPVRS